MVQSPTIVREEDVLNGCRVFGFAQCQPRPRRGFELAGLSEFASNPSAPEPVAAIAAAGATGSIRTGMHAVRLRELAASYSKGSDSRVRVCDWKAQFD